MNMYLIEIKRHCKSFFMWVVALGTILSIFMSFFPSMASSDVIALFKAKMEAIPEVVRSALSINEIVDFSDLLQYAAYVLQFIFIAGCVYGLILGSTALIKEESEGTIEFLYAKPISRMKILTMKILSTLTMLVALNLYIYIICIIFFEIFKKPDYQYLNALTMIFKGMTFVQIAFLAIGFLVTVSVRRYNQSIPIALGLFAITAFFGIFSKISKDLDWLQYFSPYHYVIPMDILHANGLIENSKLLLLGGITVFCIIVTYFRYTKKDLLL